MLITNNDITIFLLATLLGTQHFVTTTVVRRSYTVAIRKVVLNFCEDFVWNIISNKLSGYSEKTNN
jgi:hypothetical protein